jgi:peroxiredoxin
MKTQQYHRILGRGSCYVALVAVSVLLSGCREKPAPTATDPPHGGATAVAPDGPRAEPAESPRTAEPAGTEPDLAVEALPAEDSATVVTIAPVQPNDSPGSADASLVDAPPAPAGASGDGQPPQAIRIELAEPPYPPQVYFSERHAKTNLVGVGEAMPDVTLPDLEGQSRTLRDLYGQRLTVVLFWTASRVFAAEEFTQLSSEVAETFAAAGVNVVAINVGDSAEDVQPLVHEATGRIANLRDEDRTAFAAVASEHLPRVYLLDGTGKILWFDIEYSRSTRRELRNAVVYQLQQANLLKSNGD